MRGRRGSVFFEERLVGQLSEAERGRIRFCYDAQWVRSGFSISLSLPISRGLDEVEAHAFFAGLLPEGLSRQRICRRYRLGEDDDLGLLLAIGRDCAGALAVLPENAAPEKDDSEPVALTDEDLSRLVESRGQAVPAGEPGQRFSLAGAQDKLAVRIEDDRMWLPDRVRPSTHILKFETTRWVCFAEFMGNELARRLGLPVPVTEFRQHGADRTSPFLVVARFDRRRDAAGRIRRVHQEDVVQALGLDGAAKYQEHGGPSLGLIATLLRRHSADPVADVRAPRDWQIFNTLAGNSDGHGKNLALLYAPDSSVPRLAPFYDLVCIEFLDRIGIRYDRSLAFFVGINNLPEQITKGDWKAHAADLGVPAATLFERLREMAEALPVIATEARSSFAAHFGDSQIYDRFEESISDRCRWVLRSVFGRG